MIKGATLKLAIYIRKLKQNNYDKIIVFGLQLTHFLKGYLIRNFKDDYIIDIRDYNKIIKISKLDKVISFAGMRVISSPGYLVWLPKSGEYIINHNTNIKKVNELRAFKPISSYNEINISYIGTLVNYNINKNLINSLRNNNKFNIVFHGDGIINNELQSYMLNNNIKNVEINGRYNQAEEKNIYRQADLTNALFYDETINHRTCLANRLYKSVFYGKPILVFRGTYLASVVEKYDLGLILNSFEDIDLNIMKYIDNLDNQRYESNRINFFKDVIATNKVFEKKLIYTLTNKSEKNIS